MNREQRRKDRRHKMKEARERLSRGVVLIENVPASGGFKVGDKITIAGYRMYPDGRQTNKCLPGEETILQVNSLDVNA